MILSSADRTFRAGTPASRNPRGVMPAGRPGEAGYARGSKARISRITAGGEAASSPEPGRLFGAPGGGRERSLALQRYR